MGARLRRSATAASRKRIALEFIKRYFAEFGCSPSFGEIGAALSEAEGGAAINVARVSEVVHQLAADGELIVAPGQRRGILLPDLSERISESDALRRLRQLGYGIILRQLYEPGMNTGLPGVEILDHLPAIETGGGGDDDGNEQRRDAA